MVLHASVRGATCMLACVVPAASGYAAESVVVDACMCETRQHQRMRTRLAKLFVLASLGLYVCFQQEQGLQGWRV